MSTCDKCGREVPRENDATLLDVEAGFMKSLGVLLMSARHLAPVDGCTGSPSRWQYLGGPPDPHFPMNEETGKRYRAAYERLRKAS